MFSYYLIQKRGTRLRFRALLRERKSWKRGKEEEFFILI